MNQNDSQQPSDVDASRSMRGSTAIGRIDQYLKAAAWSCPECDTVTGQVVLCDVLQQILSELIPEANAYGFARTAERLANHRRSLDKIEATLKAAAAIAESIKRISP